MSGSRYVCDIETNSLLPDVSTIHCLVILDLDTCELFSCTDADATAMPISAGIKKLSEAQLLVGHNIIEFDLPALRKMFPEWKQPRRIVDTLVLSRLYYPDIKTDDYVRSARNKDGFPLRLIGSHSLEAWGYRIGELKDNYGKTTDWQEWTPEMQAYCEQDVRVTRKLCMHLLNVKKAWGGESARLEHDFAEIIQKQEEFGFTFDTEAARELYTTLADKRNTIIAGLQKVFPPIDKGEYFTPKASNKTKGYVKGVTIWRSNLIEFNPASRDHIAERLNKCYGWTPTAYTDNGKPKVDDEVLAKLDYPEIPLLREYLLIDKRIGQIAEGNQAWLKHIVAGRIHGRVITNGAVQKRINKPLCLVSGFKSSGLLVLRVNVAVQHYISIRAAIVTR